MNISVIKERIKKEFGIDLNLKKGLGDLSYEEFIKIWQRGYFTRLTKSRNETNHWVRYYIDKYGYTINTRQNIVRTTPSGEDIKHLGNSWHPIKHGRVSRLFWRNSNECYYWYETFIPIGTKVIHLNEVDGYEEEYIIDPNDLTQLIVKRKLENVQIDGFANAA